MKKVLYSCLGLLTFASAKAQKLFQNTNDYFSEYRYFMDDCDVCGCSATGGSMGFNSMLNNRFIGVRYMFQSYHSRDGVFSDSPWIDENFNTAQLWAKYPLSDRFEVMALIPYHFNTRQKSAGSTSVSGLGDLTFMGFYNLLRPETEANVQHKLQVGTGIKVPTGTYNEQNNGSVNPSFQLGTGSWDYSVATDYTLTKAHWGLNANANYVFKTENKQHYQFGNQFNYAGTLFYKAEGKTVTWVPQLGIAGEVYAVNKDFKEAVLQTSGDIVFAKTALEIGISKWSVGVNAMLPINQNLTGGKVESDYRLAININYLW